MAATYYVSTTGNDTNPGTALSPFLTVQRGVTAAVAGDTVLVQPGTYLPPIVTLDVMAVEINNVGTAAAPITIKSVTPLAAILNGNLTAHSYFDFQASSAWIIIDGFSITNTRWGGVWSNAGGAANCTIQNCYIYNIGNRVEATTIGIAGIYTDASAVMTVNNCRFSHIGRTNDALNAYDQEIYSHGNLTITNNIFCDFFTGWAIQCAAGFSGTIAGNWFFGPNGYGTKPGQIMLWNAEGNVTINSNVFYNPRTAAVTSITFSFASLTLNNNQVYGTGVTLQDFVGGTVSGNTVQALSAYTGQLPCGTAGSGTQSVAPAPTPPAPAPGAPGSSPTIRKPAVTNQSNLATTFTAPPVGSLVDQDGMASQRFQIYLNALYKRFLIQRTNLTPVSSNYSINLSDSTVQAILAQPNPVVLTLPDPKNIQGQVYNIKNDASSVSTASMAATGNALIDNAPPSSVVLAPGQSMTLKSDGTNWIKLAFFANTVTSAAPAATATNSANGAAPVALGPSGTPSAGTPLAPGTPIVTSLPTTSDPLSVIGNHVLLNGVPYIFTAGLTGSTGYWALDVTYAPSISDTAANLSLYPAANYPVGTVFRATDWNTSWAVQIPSPTFVHTWIYYNGIDEDVLANIPMSLGLTEKGFLFRASDYLHNWLWTGSAWSLIAAAQIGFQGGLFPGTTMFSVSGPPLGGGVALWQLCDGSTVPVSQENASVVNTVMPTIANTWFVR